MQLTILIFLLNLTEHHYEIFTVEMRVQRKDSRLLRRKQWNSNIKQKIKTRKFLCTVQISLKETKIVRCRHILLAENNWSQNSTINLISVRHFVYLKCISCQDLVLSKNQVQPQNKYQIMPKTSSKNHGQGCMAFEDT